MAHGKGRWLLVLLMLALGRGLTAQPAREPHTFLRKYVRFTDADLKAMDAGEVVVKTLDTTEKREVAAFGVVHVRTTKDFFVDRFRDIVTFKATDRVAQIGKFHVPPSLDDVRPLTLDREDIEAIRQCRVGNCGVRLPAAAIERFRKEVNWSAPDYRDRVTNLTRQMLVDNVTAYLAGGNAALGEYRDKKTPVRLAAEFRALLAQSPYLFEYAPAFHRYLEDFPNASLPDVENFVYWSKEKFGPKPVISLTHVTIHRRTPPSGLNVLIASKQIYASHYLDASLGLTALVDGPGNPTTAGFYMMYFNRSRADVLGGRWRALARAMIRGRTRDGMEQYLRLTKQKLEASFKRRG